MQAHIPHHAPRSTVFGLLALIGLFVLPLASLAPPAHPPSRPAAPGVILSLTAVADTYVREDSPSQASGAAQQLNVYRTEFLQQGYALIRFDLGDVPAGRTINNASLTLYLDSGMGASPVNVTIARVTSAWNEASVNWTTRPSETGAYGSQSVTTTPGTVTWDITTLVQQWYAGTHANFGLAVHGPAGVSFERQFASREDDLAPQLVLDYTGPTVTPGGPDTATPTITPTPTRTPTRTPSPTATYPPTNTPNPAAPELIVSSGRLGAMRVVNYINEKTLYWAEDPGEFCSPQGTLKRMNLLSLEVQTLHTTCASIRHLRVAGNRLYFAEGNLVRFVDRHSGSALTTAATASVRVDALMVSRFHYVFFADAEGIKKWFIGGTTRNLVPGAQASDMTLDSTYLYWLDPARDRLERVTFRGENRTTLASGLTAATRLAIPYFYEDGLASDTPGHVYYANNGGIFGVRPDTGAIFTATAPVSPFNVSSLASDGISVYWTDTAQHGGAVLRVGAGGGPREPIAINRGGPALAQAVQGYIYWAQGSGIYRLPTNAVPFADLSLTGMEITQGVQDLANSVPLVRDRPTYVRVHPATSLDVADVQVLLYGEQAGVPLPYSPLTPLGGRMDLLASGHSRAEWDQSFNFVLPSAWQGANITLRAVINPSEAVPETTYANNSLSVTRSFTAKSAVCFKFMSVNSDDGRRYHTGLPGFRPILDRFETVWPVPQVRYFTTGTTLNKPFGDAFNVANDSDYIIFALWENNFWNGEPGWCTADGARAHYIAMIHPDTNTTSSSGVSRGGYGSLIEPLAWVKMRGTSLSRFDEPAGGVTLAHEAAHNYSGLGNRWKHINCGLSSDDYNPGWPYVDTMRIANDGPATGWGFDRYNQEVIEPTEARDYMSYCTPRWVSAYNWTGIFNALNSPTTSSPAAAPQSLPAAPTADDLLVVLGTLSNVPDRNLMYAYRLSPDSLTAKQNGMLAAARAAAPAADPSYVLQLLGANDVVLASQPFTPAGASDDASDLSGPAAQGGGAEEALSYLVSIAYHPDALAIRVTTDGVEVSRLEVSDHAPTVALTSPANGATIGSTLNLSWSASDADGDDLRYNVLYSSDLGATWQALATGHTATSLVLTDTTEMLATAGAQGQLRVVASDGVHTAQDTVINLTVLNHPPQVHLSRPTPGQIFRAGQIVVAGGQALDPDEGPLSDGALTWSLNGEPLDVELLGGGGELLLPDLPPGYHTLKLTAQDSPGAQHEAEVTFFVASQQLYLPVVGH